MTIAQAGRHLITQTPDVKRWGTGNQGTQASVQGSAGRMRPLRPADGVADSYSSRRPTNDGLIRRDGQPLLLTQFARRAGLSVNNWTGAGPARPTIWTERGQTITPRFGSERWLQNPNDPGWGLHTQINNDASGAIGSAARYTDPGVQQQRGRRQNRLSPARYTGQSYSQTTKIQGAR